MPVLTRLRVVAPICSCLLLGASAAAAQTSSDFFRKFNTIAPSAIVEATRTDWNKLSSRETTCIDDTLHKQGGSVEALIQRGVTTSDSRIAGVRANCRFSSPQQATQPPGGSVQVDVPVNNLQNRLTQLARAKADADAARQTAEQAAEKAQTDAESARKGFEAAERDARLARTEIEKLRAETARVTAALHQLEADKVATDAKANTIESIFYGTTIIFSIAFAAVTAWLVVTRKQMAIVANASGASAANLRVDPSFAGEPLTISAPLFEPSATASLPNVREPATSSAANNAPRSTNQLRYWAILARAGAQTVYSLVFYFLFLPAPLSLAFLVLLFHSFPEAISTQLTTLISSSFMEFVAPSMNQ